MPHYKFIKSVDAISHVLSGAVKFARISELNDPSELVPRVERDEVKRSLDEFRTRGFSHEDLEFLRKQERLLSRLAPERMAIRTPATPEKATEQIKSLFYQRIDVLESLLRETARLISERVGVFCVAETISSLPMWAHYTDLARGFVVEYRNLNSLFCGDDTGVLNQLIPVRYSRDQLGVTFDPRSHESIFFAKFPDWSYEREFRIVRPLEDCTRIKTDTGEIYSIKIPKKHIARIICGWNMPKEDRAFIAQKISDLNTDVELCHAKINTGNIEILTSENRFN